MLNTKLIAKIFGSLLFLEAILMSTCLIVSIYYNGTDMASFLFTIMITTLCGLIFRHFGKDADNNMSRRMGVVLRFWNDTIHHSEFLLFRHHGQQHAKLLAHRCFL